ncbi:bacillithiol biosynthesis deacetylase BshB1 [Paenibacillus sp. J31TS4]|uniref:bacillithiol biosynthesis deacetylase BshB1 n=1 Tax=Paenibacillus sp. J31TS4 TaxID=2807195 RepID=UPI001B1785A6|nr:bacillithiol biosynthesis deacetylase BshB1 [Paenibacillus sp. J31TS4]GIP37440.1 bacillithiol biosynthesis deacetylase BshB1 [Paenibacillus sp. J31TS4]
MTALDILVFGAHPDDAEIGMGGTIVKHTRRGLKVGICDLTNAEMSSNGTVESRRREAQEAARLLGLADRSNLGLPDRGLTMDRVHIDPIVRAIRRYRPRLVFAPYWEDRHPDHVQCSKMVREAVFNAKLKQYLPDSPPVQVEDLVFYFINDTAEPDLMVDVTDVYETKMETLRAYGSQFVAGGTGVKTPLNQGYLDNVAARDRVLGQRRLIRYAEGFVTQLPHLVDVFARSE